MNTQIEFTRVNNDINGNPRYVCHYSSLLSLQDANKIDVLIRGIGRKNKFSYRVDAEYFLALQKAKKIGGKKYHNKQYGGGIVFQSYNIENTEKRILELLETGN